MARLMTRHEFLQMALAKRAYALALRRTGLTLREVGERLGGIKPAWTGELIGQACADERLASSRGPNRRACPQRP